MGIIDSLFGGKKNIIDEAMTGIDSTVLSAQEIIEYRLKARENYGPFKLIQRLLAMTFCVPFVVAWCLSFTFVFLGVDVPDNALKMLDGRMGDAVALIVGFYFLGGTISGIIKK